MKKLLSAMLAMSMIFSLITVGFADTKSANGTSSGKSANTGNSTGFVDVPDTAWFAKGVKYCKDKGIMSGIDATHFDPNGNCTRGQMAAVMYRACGSPDIKDSEMSPKFKDVKAGAFYEKAVYWCRNEGIMSGYDAEKFGPDDNITREQIVTILWRYLDSPEVTAEDFADKDQIASYAQSAVSWARRTGVVAGKDGNVFDPKGLLTRAQMAAIFQRFLEG